MEKKSLNDLVIERITKTQGHFNQGMYIMLQPFIEIAYNEGFNEGYRIAYFLENEERLAEVVAKVEEKKSERADEEALDRKGERADEEALALLIKAQNNTFNPDEYYTFEIG